MLDNYDWTAEIVGRMHKSKIKGQELADASGYNSAYLSMVLNGRKGSEDTKKRIFNALERLEAVARQRGESPDPDKDAAYS